MNFKASSKSRRQIETRLRQKGIEADIIRNVCDEYYEDNRDSELEQARAFVSRKHLDKEHPDYKEIQKVKAALYRKGFGIDVINRALDIVDDDSYIY